MISKKIIAIAVILIMVAAALGSFVLLSKPSDRNNKITFINQAGSTTMYELALVWTKNYETNNSMVQINVTEEGSAVGIARLLARYAYSGSPSCSRWYNHDSESISVR